MKIHSVDQNYNQNISYKAYFKANKNLEKIINNSSLSNDSIALAEKILKKLPNHELEVTLYEVRDTNRNLYSAKIHNNVTGKERDICLFADEKSMHFNAILYNLDDSGIGFWIKSVKQDFYSKITRRKNHD